MTMNTKNSFICPFCHAEVPEGALACPECGSDEQTGWSDDIYGLRSEEVKDTSSPNLKKFRIAFSAIIILSIVIVLLKNQMAVILLPILLIALILLIVVEFIYRKAKDTLGEGVYAKLLFRSRGDKELVERLVHYEKQKNPFRTRKQLLADALDRLEKDNR
jgi:hypothetical protein